MLNPGVGDLFWANSKFSLSLNRPQQQYQRSDFNYLVNFISAIKPTQNYRHIIYITFSQWTFGLDLTV